MGIFPKRRHSSPPTFTTSDVHHPQRSPPTSLNATSGTKLDMYFCWIYTASKCGKLFSWGLSVCPSGTGLGHVHFIRYVFVLDIFCQQLWGVVHLGGVCVPFRHRVGSCTTKGTTVIMSWGANVLGH